MKSIILFALLSVLWFVASVQQQQDDTLKPQLKCDPTTINQYKFSMVSSVFGGAYFHIEGKLEVYCGDKVFSNVLGTDLFISSVYVTEAKTYFEPPKCNIKTESYDPSQTVFEQKCPTMDAIKDLVTPQNYPGFQKPFGFIQTSNGKIVKMFSHIKETLQNRDIKKAIVSQFQTKLVGEDRVVNDNDGNHSVHYSQDISEDGTAVITASYDHTDMVGEKEKKNSQGAQQYSETQVELSSSGTVKKISNEASYELDTDAKLNEKVIPREGGVASSTDDPTQYISVSGSLTIERTGSRPAEVSQKQFHKMLIFSKYIVEGEATSDVVQDELDQVLDDHDFEIESLQVLVNEELRKAQLTEHSLSVDHSVYSVRDHIYKKVQNQGGIEKLLDAIVDGAKRGMTLLIQYVEYFPEETLLVVKKKYPLCKDHTCQSRFQALMAESQSATGVAMLMDTIKQIPADAKVIQTGLVYFASFKEPTMEMAKFVESFMDFKAASVSEGDAVTINRNAYLILANIASKLTPEQAKPFLMKIVANTQEEEDEKELKYHMNALHNIGAGGNQQAVEAVEKIVDSNEASTLAKVSAVQTLKSHILAHPTNGHAAFEHADTLIHKIALSDRYSDEVRVAAVRVQTHRENVLHRGASVQGFKSLLFRKNQSSDISHAVLEYYMKVKNEAAAQAFEEAYASADDEARVMFLGSIGDWFSSTASTVGNAISTGANAVGDALSTGANAVGNFVTNTAKTIADAAGKLWDNVNIVKKAEEIYNTIKSFFSDADDTDFSQRCYKTNMKGDQLCVTGPFFKEVLERAEGLGNMKTSKQFIWEKREGSGRLYAYVGAMGLTASRVPSCADVSEDNSLLWANILAFDSFARLLIFKAPILSAEIQFSRIQDGAEIDDRIYVSVANLFIIERTIIPSGTLIIKGAEFNLRNAMNCEPQDLDFDALKVEKKFIEKERIVMAGYVPLKFKFTLTGNLGLGIRLDICFQTYKVMAGPAPYINIEAEIAGGVTVGVADALIVAKPSSEVRLPILLGIDGCSFAADVSIVWSPFNFKLQFRLEVPYLDVGISWTLYEYKVDDISYNIFRYPFPNKPLPADEQPSVVDPTTLAAPENPPTTPNMITTNGWWVSKSSIVSTLGREPTLDELKSRAPPGSWVKQATLAAFVEHKGLQCGWVEMISFYATGWVWIPSNLNKITALITTDDKSWTFVNDQLVFTGSCCGQQTVDLSNSPAIKKGAWNKVYSVAGEWCYYGVLRVEFKFDPTTDVPAPAPVANTNMWKFAGWYMSASAIAKSPAGRLPTRQELVQLAPPSSWSTTQNLAPYLEQKGVKCSDELLGFYIVGWVFIPQTGPVVLSVFTDDVSWVDINGVQVINNFCCGVKTHDLSNHYAIKRGEWNKIFALAADVCYIGYLGLDFNVDVRTSLPAPSSPPAITNVVSVDAWYTSITYRANPGISAPPSETQFDQLVPPQTWTMVDTDNVYLEKTDVPCGWQALYGMYAFTWMWIPTSGRVMLKVATDDISWIYLNDRLIFSDGCCGKDRLHDISNDPNLKRGQWNKIYAKGVGFCYIEFLGVEVVFDPRYDLGEPSQAPANPGRVKVDAWYTSVVKRDNPGINSAPSVNTILALAPPVKWQRQNAQQFYMEVTDVPCGWVQMYGMYSFGWIWVPQSGNLVLEVSTDDISTIFINDVVVIQDGCCQKNLRHDISGHQAIKRNAWNKVYGVAAGYCYVEFFGIQIYEDPRRDLPAPRYTPQLDGNRVIVDGWWTSEGSKMYPDTASFNNKDIAERIAPPTQWSLSYDANFYMQRDATPCDSSLLRTFYAASWVYVPASGRVVLLISTDDNSWTYLNGQLVANDGCCGYDRVRDISNHGALKRNSWNLITGMGVGFCYIEFYGIKVAFDPRIDVPAPNAPPPNPNVVSVNAWYTARNKQDNPGINSFPDKNGVESRAPPVNWVKSKDQKYYAEITNVPCDWKVLHSMYAFSWVWVPSSGAVSMYVSTDDVSWVYINDQLVTADGCCAKDRYKDISNHPAIRRNAWNKVYGVGAGACYIEFFGIWFA